MTAGRPTSFGASSTPENSHGASYPAPVALLPPPDRRGQHTSALHPPRRPAGPGVTAPAFTYKNAPAQLPLPGADNDRQEVAVLKRLSTHNLPRFRHGRVDPVDVVPDEQAVPNVVHLYLQATAVQPGDKALCGTAKAAPNRYGTRYRWPNVPPDTQPCVVCVSLMQDGGV